MPEQKGEKSAESIIEHHAIGHIRKGCTQPVAPGDIESDIVAESCLSILVYSGIVLRVFVAKPFERHHKWQYTCRSYYPCPENRLRRCLRGHILRQVVYAYTYHKAEHKRRKAPESKFSCCKHYVSLFFDCI